MSSFDDAVERRIREVTPAANVTMLRSVLAMFVDLDCAIEVPSAQRRDYLNVMPPPGHGSNRLCSVNDTSTTRVEFQRDSFDLADAAGLVPPFEHLENANKAALTPTDDTDIDALRQLALVVLPALRAL